MVGYVPDRPRIEALLVAERGASLRLIGRAEFRRPGVLDDDAREALRFLTRPKPCIPVARPGRGIRWIEPRLIAIVKRSAAPAAARSGRRCYAGNDCRVAGPALMGGTPSFSTSMGKKQIQARTYS